MVGTNRGQWGRAASRRVKSSPVGRPPRQAGSSDLPDRMTGFVPSETPVLPVDVISRPKQTTFLPPDAITCPEETGALAGKPSRSRTKRARWQKNRHACPRHRPEFRKTIALVDLAGSLGSKSSPMPTTRSRSRVRPGRSRRNPSRRRSNHPAPGEIKWPVGKTGALAAKPAPIGENPPASPLRRGPH